jgi:hypothetical protein
MRSVKHILALTVSLVCMSACDLLDCTQADVKGLRIEMFNNNGERVVLTDTLTIKACGKEIVFLNKSVNTDEILLPLSYNAPEDTFVFECYGMDYFLRDTLYVKKTNNLYFESPDCPTVMMHTIEDAGCSNVFMDSVIIENKKVNFEEVVHLNLYIRG